MSATHADGPWVIGHSYTDEHAIRVGSDEDLCVAVVCALDPQSDEAQANAALVATGPELLEAVDNVIEWIETGGKSAGERVDDEKLAAVLRSVAARARGDRGGLRGTRMIRHALSACRCRRGPPRQRVSPGIGAADRRFLSRGSRCPS